MNKATKIKLNDLIITAFITLLIIWLQWLQPTWLERIEGISYDFKLVNFSAPAPKPTTNIQIIDIDEQSLKSIGRWPWPRKKLAQLLEQLTKSGAVVIAFDMLFSEAQQNPVDRVEQALQHNEMNLDLSQLRRQLDDDAQFAQSIAENDVILGTLFQQNSDLHQGTIQAPAIYQPNKNFSHLLNKYQGYNASINKLNHAAQGQGFINAVIDDDGFIRRTALLSDYQGILYPSLALETFRVYSFVEDIKPLWHHQQNISLLSGLSIGNAFIATDNKAQLLIPFRDNSTPFQYTSASKVIFEEITDNRFNGAVVFVGSSAVGMSDLRTTPISLTLPGVEIHATVFAALMQPGQQPVQPEWWLGANIMLLIMLAMIFSLMITKLAPLAMTLLAIFIIIAIWASNIALWYFYSIHLPIIAIITLPFLISAIAISKGFYRENMQRKQVKAIFDQYVPPAHIEQLLNEPEAITMDGERKELTVLFADIRNFTVLSENLPANALKALLNDYFSPITEIIFNHQGTIDKYVGDMVMAFWGAPLNDKNHAEHALDAAFAMLKKTEKLSQQFQAQGLPAISIGVGLNTGEMNVGDMGSHFRRAYTVLGDAVNLGSRLESLTKFYGVELLISEATKMQCSNYHFHVIDKVKVKGKQQAITIYSPLAKNCNNAQTQQAHDFQSLFDNYQQKEFVQALKLLNNMREKYGDSILLQQYQQRLDYLIATPPKRNWDGVFTHQHK